MDNKASTIKAKSTKGHTKVVDGYRWELTDQTGYSGTIKAIPQKRCTTDSGQVYFQYCKPDAQFSTIAMRDEFLAAFTAKQWTQDSNS